jgi:hypothetical protein
VSPVGVNDFDTQMHSGTSYCMPGNNDSALYLDSEPFDDEIAADPLEWLLGGGGINHLPESSLEHAPMFPEFHHEDYSYLDVADVPSKETSELNIADPKVTVQSLFLESEQ